jgi:hypothetical protein
MKIRSLGIDPGTNNCAYSVIETNGTQLKLLEHGRIRNTLRDLTGNQVGQSGIRFQREVRSIVRYWSAEYLTAERFQTRGPKGATIEYVSAMLGLLWNVGVKPNNIRFVTAAQWKNAWNRVADLKEFYETCGTSDHQVDATNIAIYGAELALDIKPHFLKLPALNKFAQLLIKSNIETN